MKKKQFEKVHHMLSSEMDFPPGEKLAADQLVGRVIAYQGDDQYLV